MNQKIKTISTILLIFIASIFLAIILAPWGGALYLNFTNTRCSSGLFLLESFDTKCAIEGFIYFYVLFITFFSFIFLKQRSAWLMGLISTFPIWALYLFIIITEDLKFQKKVYIGSLILALSFFTIGLAAGLIAHKFRKAAK